MRRVGVVLLCEDTQHESFARRFLVGMGWEFRQFRVEKGPKGRVSGESWVRAKFPDELAEYRRQRGKASTILIAMTDADEKEVQDRVSDFEGACRAKNVPSRTAEDAVAIAVPKRNIETWIHYLKGESVNEAKPYRKLERPSDCRSAVDQLVQQCRSTGLDQNAPPSLSAACREYRERIEPARLH